MQPVCWVVPFAAAAPVPFETLLLVFSLSPPVSLPGDDEDLGGETVLIHPIGRGSTHACEDGYEFCLLNGTRARE